MPKLNTVSHTLTLVCSSLLVACAPERAASQFDFGVGGEPFDSDGTGTDPGDPDALCMMRAGISPCA